MSMVSQRDLVAVARLDAISSDSVPPHGLIAGRWSAKPPQGPVASAYKVLSEGSWTADGARHADFIPTNSFGRDRAFRAQPVGGRLKRLADIVVASVGCVLAAPLLLILALAIKLSMGGPVIYRHRRVGFAGQAFHCLKFRTMVANGDEILKRHLATHPEAAEEWRQNRKLTNDPRVTRLGSFLRKTSLDELPQLINILRGEMSCVGPRPIVSEELERYGVHAHEYLRARPGVTGAWQVSGRNSVSYTDRVKLDTEYVRRWSFSADLSILVRTLPAVLKTSQTA